MKIKKLLSLLLALCMALSLTTAAFAEAAEAALPAGPYPLKVFSEDQNGDRRPDCASVPAETALTAGKPVTVAYLNDYGTVEPSPALACAGELVTLTVTPNSNYVLKRLIVRDDENRDLAVDSENGYSFGMPESGVTVTAEWEPETGSDGWTPEMNWANLQAALNLGGEIVLPGDLAAEAGDPALSVPALAEVVLDLNGHRIDRGLTEAEPNGNVITNLGRLTITDTSTAQTGTITGGYNTGSGGAIINNGTLTLAGGTISGNRGQEAGAVLNAASCLCTLAGGTMENNAAFSFGGGAVINRGTFVMSGGQIRNNTATMNGGGVWTEGALTLTGGAITGNNAQYGGGVFVTGDTASINLQGSPVILNNQAASDGANVFLRSGAHRLNVTGALGADARIGVTLAVGAGTVTSGFGGSNGGSGQACFLPDNSAYGVGVNSDHEIVFGPAVTVSFDPGLGSGTMEPVRAAQNSYYILPECGFTPPFDHSFDSWYVNVSSYAANSDLWIAGDVTLTALYADHKLNRVEAVTPTCTDNGNIEHYVCADCGRYFVDENGAYTEISASDTVLPYFTVNDNGSYLRVIRYNGADAEITIPDTVPDNYPDETLRGRAITAVNQSAFANNTVITKVVMGDNIQRIGWHAFYNASNLREVEVGAGLLYLEASIINCPALVSFTCTTTEGLTDKFDPYIYVYPYVFDLDVSNITFYGMHSGAFRNTVSTPSSTPSFAASGTRRYVGLDAHSAPTWTWAADLNSAEAVFDCASCDFAETVPATVSTEITTEPTVAAPGLKTCTASVTVTGVTYTDTRTAVLPMLPCAVVIAENIPYGTVTADRAEACAGDTVNLTAVPEAGCRFKAWNVTDANGRPVTVTNNSFVMPASDVTVSAEFEPQYTVTVETVAHGVIFASVQRAYPGDPVNLTAEPEEGCRLRAWIVTDANGRPVTVTNNSFLMPASDVTVSAEINPQYTITVPIVEHGVLHASVQQAYPGDTVTLSASPDEGYRLALRNLSGVSSWIYWAITPDDGSGEFYVPSDRDYFVMPAANVTVSAEFEPIRYMIFVGGRQVTYVNADDVFEDGGSVRYDAASETLTLSSAVIPSQLPYDWDYHMMTTDKTNICAAADLTIVLSGNNVLSSDPDTNVGIDVYGNLTLSGTGSLSYCCTCNAASGIVASGALSLEDQISLRIYTTVEEQYAASFIALRGTTALTVADTLEIVAPTHPLIQDGWLFDTDREPAFPTMAYGLPPSVVIRSKLAGRFIDVPMDAWYHDPVCWAADAGITDGTTEITFSPDQACTREQIVTFLWRACGSPEPTIPESPFLDVQNPNAYYYKAVLWACETGITNGVSSSAFGVRQPCTRAQIVTFLWRLAGSAAPTQTETGFDDVPAAAWYAEAVRWAAEHEITAGTSHTTFSPARPCTRAQAVTFLWKAQGAPEPQTAENPFTDVNPEKYYYKAVPWAVENGVTAGMTADTFGVNVTCTRAQIATFLYKCFVP